jgi:SAM-dependent methyltransferase
MNVATQRQPPIEDNVPGGVALGADRMTVDEYLRIAAPRSGYKSPESLLFRCESVFKDVDLAGRSVLEIGAGSGTLCFWAGFHGAQEVVGLEPDIAGSTHGDVQLFETMIDQTGLNTVKLCKKTIQEYRAPVEQFDVVVSHNSMEHLDESVVSRLRSDASARQVYAQILQGVARSMKPGAQFIICNQSMTNFWPMVGRRNPFSPTVDWPLHPTPRTWKRLLLANGFRDVEVDWPVRYRARRLGPLAANAVFAFFTDSMFRITARR